VEAGGGGEAEGAGGEKVVGVGLEFGDEFGDGREGDGLLFEEDGEVVDELALGLGCQGDALDAEAEVAEVFEDGVAEAGGVEEDEGVVVPAGEGGNASLLEGPVNLVEAVEGDHGARGGIEDAEDGEINLSGEVNTEEIGVGGEGVAEAGGGAGEDVAEDRGGVVNKLGKVFLLEDGLEEFRLGDLGLIGGKIRVVRGGELPGLVVALEGILAAEEEVVEPVVALWGGDEDGAAHGVG